MAAPVPLTTQFLEPALQHYSSLLLPSTRARSVSSRSMSTLLQVPFLSSAPALEAPREFDVPVDSPHSVSCPQRPQITCQPMWLKAHGTSVLHTWSRRFLPQVLSSLQTFLSTAEAAAGSSAAVAGPADMGNVLQRAGHHSAALLSHRCDLLPASTVSQATQSLARLAEGGSTRPEAAASG